MELRRLCVERHLRRQRLLGYFDEAAEPCGNCDTCLAPPRTSDATIAPQKLLSALIRLDRTDEAFEAFLLEFLSDFSISIPERGTLRAPERPRITPPVGNILFIAAKDGGVRVEPVIRQMLPFFAALLIALLLVVLAAMTVEMAMGFAVATLLHRRRQTDMTDMAQELSR